MPTPKFSKSITWVFNSTEVNKELRHDIACRLIGESLNLATVSMLMYDAQLDKICCRGSYLGPHTISKFECDSAILNDIIEHIAIYEYFDTGISDRNGKQTLKEFNETLISIKSEYITENVFEECRENWKTKEYKQAYAKYKTGFASELYDIDDSTLSGSYFKYLSSNEDFTNEVWIKYMIDGPRKGEGFFEIWKRLGVNLYKDKIFYIGLPLFANGRYIGILRLTSLEGQSDSIDELYDFFKNKDLKNQSNLKLSIAERLQNFAQLTSLHLKANYYIEGYRKLSNLTVSEDYLNIEESKLSPQINLICNILAETINCNGVIIRVTHDEKKVKDPPVRGLSTTISRYQEYVHTTKDPDFSDDIFKKFSDKNNHGLKAMSFSLNLDNSNKFKIIEYRYEEENERIPPPNQNSSFFTPVDLKLKDSQLDESMILGDFTPEYIEFLKALKMIKVVVVPLEFVAAGFIIMTNTSNRKFTLSDIEMVLLASKRIGSEFKLINNLADSKKTERLSGLLNGLNFVAHQVGQLLRGSSDKIEEIMYHKRILEKRNFDNITQNDISNVSQIAEKIRLLNFFIHQCQQQNLRSKRIQDIAANKIVVQKSEISNLWLYIRNKCLDLDAYANLEKGLHVWLFNLEERNIKFETDEELFSELIYNLIDNAVKYSFDAKEMKGKNIAFDNLSPRSEGNISVKYALSYSQLILEVTNWGNLFKSNEKNSIFELFYRGSNATMGGPSGGSGIGLYLVKKIAVALNGDVEVATNFNKNMITFRLTINR